VTHAGAPTGVGELRLRPSRTRAARRWLGSDANRPLVVAAVTSVVLGVIYLCAGRMGGDLSAQMARSEFTSAHPFSVVDFRWFGGSLPFGYSLWTTYAMALIGPRVLGAIASVVATCFTVRLLQRAGARRPALGAIAAAACQASNLAEGRVTFACGMAVGLGALLTLPGPWGRFGSDGIPDNANNSRQWILTIALTFLAGAASPVATLFLWIVSAVLLIDRRWKQAVVLGVVAAIPTAVMVVVFADGGPQPFNGGDAIRAALASALVVAIVPRRNVMIRNAALIGLLMVIAAYHLHTSVGGNSMRLTLLFAVPVVVAMVDRNIVVSGAIIALAIVVQSPVTWGTLAAAGKAQTRMPYYEPMLDQIKANGPLTGRVQIPELTGHWEAVFAAREVPLARGWLRQADTKLNSDPFYGHPLTATTYRAWLDLNAVQYVALSNARLTHTGTRERVLLQTGLPYLTKVWSNSDWTLYAVDDPTPIVDAPGTLIKLTPTQITVDLPASTTVTVRVREFKYLDVKSADGTCLSTDGRWTQIHATNGGQYTITGSLTPSSHC
jgi:hypothetical protein